MRDSFVLHAEYIEDLPDEYKDRFLRYIYDYGINGILPELSGLEKTVWLKIRRRIDADQSQWDAEKSARSAAGRQSGISRRKKKDNPDGTGCPAEAAEDKLPEEAVQSRTEQAGHEPERDSVKSGRFRKPAQEEIRRFCAEKGLAIDVERFFDFYESKGWRVGSTPMKDWRAAVRNWSRGNLRHPRSPPGAAVQSDADLQNYVPEPQPQTDVEKSMREIRQEEEDDEIIF